MCFNFFIFFFDDLFVSGCFGQPFCFESNSYCSAERSEQ
jgi:hypothetical protein